MSETLFYGLLAAAVIVILISAVSVLRSLRIQREHKAALDAQAEKAAEITRKRHSDNVDSIRIIARAMREDDSLPLAEGCIRLKILLDNTAPHLLQDADFAVINRYYQKIEHIPFLKAWRDLDKQTQWQYRKEMAAVERELGEMLLAASDRLVKHPLEARH